MSTQIAFPTPYPDVNAVLDALLAGVQTVLGDHLIGMYVHGSLANGDFDPQRSDIDLLAVTAAELPAEMLRALKAMHARITAGDLAWKTNVEISYIPQQALRRYDPAHHHHPALRADGSFDVDGHGSDWVIQRYIIREKGYALVGPPPQTLIDPVRPDELRRAAQGILREWWAPQLDDHSHLLTSEYQAYAILTMCRSLYTLKHGTVSSKPVAARWAQQALEPRWAALIEQALAWRHGAELGRLNETLDLIRYTLACSQQFETARDEA
ncbi:MAG: DUF4111 domain-containing protein [Chloroflexi bacterium]|nr:DUF4111 domain-containing protein [Chloroflexota bacterium]